MAPHTRHSVHAHGAPIGKGRVSHSEPVPIERGPKLVRRLHHTARPGPFELELHVNRAGGSATIYHGKEQIGRCFFHTFHHPKYGQALMHWGVNVSEHYRREGFLRNTVIALEEVAREQGAKAILTKTDAGNAGGIAAYRKLGFHEIERKEETFDVRGKHEKVTLDIVTLAKELK